jgi:hypothetical protein
MQLSPDDRFEAESSGSSNGPVGVMDSSAAVAQRLGHRSLRSTASELYA